MFVYHRDIPNNQWNVFKKTDKDEVYVCSFNTVEKADGYCKLMNLSGDLKAEMLKMMGE